MSEKLRVDESHESDPLMIAWKSYELGPAYADTKFRAQSPGQDVDIIFVAFQAGWRIATSRAAGLYEQINPASDDERLNHVLGAGAMGAVMDYRDAICRIS